MRRPDSLRRQRGAAIVTAMLVVLLTTVIVAGLYYRTNVTVRSVENRLAIVQTHWIERGVIDWARVVLQVDGVSTRSDNLGETWANPVQDTQLDETVTGGAKIGDATASAMLAGQIYDAQARFNLNNLRLDDTNDVSLKALQRLLEFAGQPTSMAVVLRSRIQQSYTRTVNGKVVPATALPLLKLTDLRFVPGFTSDVIQAIEPYVIFLPLATSTTPAASSSSATANTGGTSATTSGATTMSITPVNVNTADPLVLAAVIPNLDLDAARRFTSQASRQYQTVNAATAAMGQGITATSGMLSVVSSYFLVRGVVRYDRVEDQTDTLLYRQGTKVDIVWQQRS